MKKIQIVVIKDLPEQSLQVLRQLGSARIPRIHGDEHTDSGDEGDQLTEEIELCLLGLDSVQYALHLHRYHGQHLHWDSVELIEATPRPCLRQPLVDVAARLEQPSIVQWDHQYLLSALDYLLDVLLNAYD